jgi:6-phosphofructo-2-kinase
VPKLPLDHHFAVPKLPHNPHESLQVPRPPHNLSSLGLALHGMAMGGLGAPEGVGHALSDTPIASTPSSAPSSPRM